MPCGCVSAPCKMRLQEWFKHVQPLEALNTTILIFSLTVAVATIYREEVTGSENHWPKTKTWLIEREHHSEMAKHNLASMLSGGSSKSVNNKLKKKRGKILNTRVIKNDSCL